MVDRVDWHTYFMNIALQVSTRSTCPRKKVGAVIARDRTILSTGYNGSIRGLPHCDEVGCVIEDGHCVSGRHSHRQRNCRPQRAGVNPRRERAHHGRGLADLDWMDMKSRSRSMTGRRSCPRPSWT